MVPARIPCICNCFIIPYADSVARETHHPAFKTKTPGRGLFSDKVVTPSDPEEYGIPGGIRTPDRRLSIPLWLSPPRMIVCGLDYIFTISGAARIVSTDPHNHPMPFGIG
ncbi:hypothetical protein HMPREF9374_0079 [Desmospora sp. 8437]|nr:hypothetical protein HMPREF9374_0079 [Desmospora sp. 8437]